MDSLENAIDQEEHSKEKKLTNREQIKRGQPKKGDILVIAGRRWACYVSDKIKERFSLKIEKEN